MAILVTGISTRADGFTLLEVMVTLVLIGIITTFAVLAVPGGSDDRADQELRRLRALIELNHQQALLRSEQRGIQFGPDSYRFMTLGESWQTDGERKLPNGLALAVSVEGQSLDLGQSPVDRPQVLLLSSGELTEFTVKIARADTAGFTTEPRQQLSGELTGRLTVTAIP